MMHRMRRVLTSLSPLKIIDQISSRKVFRKFADTYDLVYFGHVSAQDDEHRIVHGVTTSAKHHDSHYCVGTIQNHDVILLEREDELQLVTDAHPHKYKWIILQVDLHGRHDLSHVFIDGKHHNDTFYRTLFAKFSRLLRVLPCTRHQTTLTVSHRSLPLKPLRHSRITSAILISSGHRTKCSSIAPVGQLASICLNTCSNAAYTLPANSKKPPLFR